MRGGRGGLLSLTRNSPGKRRPLSFRDPASAEEGPLLSPQASSADPECNPAVKVPNFPIRGRQSPQRVIILFGSQSAKSGQAHRMTIPRHSMMMKGIEPRSTSERGTSGAIP